MGDHPLVQRSGPLHRLAQVSNVWLQTIKATPALWQCLSSEDTDYTCALIARFNPSGPIKVFFQADGRPAESTLETAIACASRWQSAYVIGSPRSISLTCSRLTVPMPNLAVLSIHANCVKIYNDEDDEDEEEDEGEEGEGEDDDNENGHNVQGSPLLVLGEGRNLLVVTLIGASLSWDSTRLAGLEVLSLFSLNQNIPRIPQLHSILSSSPSLQTLILEDFDYDGGDDALGTVDLVHSNHLDHLSTLELKRIPSKITSFLLASFLSPHVTSLDVDGLVVSCPSDLSSRFLNMPLMVPTAKHITVRYYMSRPNLAIYPTPSSPGEGEQIHDLQVESCPFRVGFEPKDMPGWKVLASWLTGFTLPPISFKTISSPWDTHGDFPFDFFESLPFLISLDIGNGYDLFLLLDYLAGNDAVCPHLTEIKLGYRSIVIKEQIMPLVRLVKARQQDQPGGPAKVKDVWAPRKVIEMLYREIGRTGVVYHLM